MGLVVIQTIDLGESSCDQPGLVANRVSVSVSLDTVYPFAADTLGAEGVLPRG